jgi:mandelamide amidase
MIGHIFEGDTARRRFLQNAALGTSALFAFRTGHTAQIDSTSSKNRDLPELSAVEAIAFLRSGELSSEQYAQALLAQCRRHRDLNAFTWQDEDQVLAAARAADKSRRKNKRQPLHGLPILLKANIGTANAPTSAGTPALREHRPPSDAPVAAKLFSAGAILLGKTNMHEMALGITSNNEAFGAVRNPYNPALISGGSSGGNGAAIAARMCAAGLGTDTGGFVRIPAALCGILGLRPTIGRYPGKGIVPLSHTRDTAGPMARTVADLALLDSVVTGESAAVQPAALKGLRLGIPRGYFYRDMDHDLASIVESGLAAMREAGCVLIEADIPDIEKLYLATLAIGYYENLHDLESYLRETRAKTDVNALIAQISSPDVKAFYETNVIGPKAPTRQEYLTAMTLGRPALQAAYRNYFRTHNVAAIAFPTTLLTARPIGEDAEVELNGKKVSTFTIYLHNTRPITTAGIPGLSLPIGLTNGGLPVGLELDGPFGSDRSLLSLGMSMEKLFGKISAPRHI